MKIINYFKALALAIPFFVLAHGMALGQSTPPADPRSYDPDAGTPPAKVAPVQGGEMDISPDQADQGRVSVQASPKTHQLVTAPALARQHIGKGLIGYGDQAAFADGKGYVVKVEVAGIDAAKADAVGQEAANRGFKALEIDIEHGTVRAAGSPAFLSPSALESWAADHLK